MEYNTKAFYFYKVETLPKILERLGDFFPTKKSCNLAKIFGNAYIL